MNQSNNKIKGAKYRTPRAMGGIDVLIVLGDGASPLARNMRDSVQASLKTSRGRELYSKVFEVALRARV